MSEMGDLQDQDAATPFLDTRRFDAPQVTVAIATHNRASYLEGVFQALSAQTLSPENFEVVIVDDGSSDDTPSRITQLAAESALQVLCLRNPAARGPAVARNMAWRRARAPVVAFTDDDCLPAPSWLVRGLEALTGEAIVVGQIAPNPLQPLGPFSRTVKRNNPKWISTSNVFYGVADLERVGGFDEAFRLPACEDTELGLRVRDELGRALLYSPEALVYHDVRPSRFMDALRETQKWTVSPRLFRLHPSAREWLHRRVFWHRSHPRVILAVLGAVLAPVFPPAILLGLPWLDFRMRIEKVHVRRRQIYVLPGVFLIDLAATIAMIRGSIRYRTLVL